MGLRGRRRAVRREDRQRRRRGRADRGVGRQGRRRPTSVGTGKDLTLKLDYATKEPGAYPVVLVTYEIVCSAGNGDKGALLKSFLGYTATDGQTTLAGLGAAPLPAEIQTKVIARGQTISS